MNRDRVRSRISKWEGLDRRVRELLAEGRLQQAAELIVRELGPSLRGYLRAVTRSDADGDEIYQEVCKAISSGIGSFRGESNVFYWCMGIVRNHLKAYFRRRAAAALPLHSEVERLAAPAPDSLPRKRALLMKLLDELGEEDRQLCILYKDYELPYRDIASLLGITEEAARKRMARIKVQLRALRRRWEPSHE